jgi:hypothetical protein
MAKSCLGSVFGAVCLVGFLGWNGYVAFTMYTDTGRAFAARNIFQEALEKNGTDYKIVSIGNIREAGGWDEIAKNSFEPLNPSELNSMKKDGKLYIGEGIFENIKQPETIQQNVCIYQVNEFFISYEITTFLCK